MVLEDCTDVETEFEAEYLARLDHSLTERGQCGFGRQYNRLRK